MSKTELFGMPEAEKAELARLNEALARIDPDDYQVWLDVGMALKNEGYPLDMWESWSAASEKYSGTDFAAKWASFTGSGLTLGTIFHYAQGNAPAGHHPGHGGQKKAPKPAKQQDPVLMGGLPAGSELPECKSPERLDLNPVQELMAYLDALFQDPHEITSVITTAQLDDKGKWRPYGGKCVTIGDLYERLELVDGAAEYQSKPDAGLNDVLLSVGAGDFNPAAGAWIGINPNNGSGRKREDLTAWRYALIECDELPQEEQIQRYAEFMLPVVAMVESAGKSVHAITRIDADSEKQYDARVRFMFEWLETHGLLLDQANKNPSRMSRLPGAPRGEKRQRLLCLSAGLPSWDAWYSWATAQDPTDEEKISILLSELERKKDGTPLSSVGNYQHIIEAHPQLTGIAYNAMSGRIECRSDLPWRKVRNGSFWVDSDDSHLRHMTERMGLQVNRGNYQDGLVIAAESRTFHPVKQYLESLPAWDRTPRIETAIIDYLGAEDTTLTREETRLTFLAAVCRIYCPGCKWDYVPVLVGRQGAGKSTFVAKLAVRPEWFNDSLKVSDMPRIKEAGEQVLGKWVIELGEMAGMSKADVKDVKSFLTSTSDHYRAAYGRNSEDRPRSCIVIGTGNEEDGFLRDTTGNRRFWPIWTERAHPAHVQDMTEDVVAQMWAEVMAILAGDPRRDAGSYPLFLPNHLEAAAQETQREGLESDPREGEISAYLDTLVPDNWYELSAETRRYKWKAEDMKNGTVRRDHVCVAEIRNELLQAGGSKAERAEADAIAKVLIKLGWKRYDKAQGKTRLAGDGYGPQTTFMRPEE